MSHAKTNVYLSTLDARVTHLWLLLSPKHIGGDGEPHLGLTAEQYSESGRHCNTTTTPEVLPEVSIEVIELPLPTIYNQLMLYFVFPFTSWNLYTYSQSIATMATITMTEPSSSAIELQQFSGALSLKSQAPSFIAPGMHSQSGENLGSITLEDVRQDAMPPSQAVEALQRWNFPRINMWRVFATFWSFLIVGMNDGSYGVSLAQ
jgi:hypothetical protein